MNWRRGSATTELESRSRAVYESCHITPAQLKTILKLTEKYRSASSPMGRRSDTECCTTAHGAALSYRDLLGVRAVLCAGIALVNFPKIPCIQGGRYLLVV